MKQDYTQCILPCCGKTLGQETRDLDYRVCHEHRLCSICNGPLLPVDVHIAHEKFLTEDVKDLSASLELAHSRCRISAGRLGTADIDPTISLQQSSYNLLNASRLMVDPDMALSIHTNENNAMIRSKEFAQHLLQVHEMEFDAVYVHLKMLEACVASVNLFIATQDRKAIKARADVREAEAFKKATKEALTSSRPTQKPADDLKEVELGAFMKIFDIKDRKIGLDLKKRRDKAIEALVKLGIKQEIAIQSCNADIVKERAPKVN